MHRAVLFDLDGTLVDTPRAIVETMTEVCRTLGYTGEMNPAQVRATVGLPLETAFGKLLEVDPQGDVVTRAVAAYREMFARTVLPRAPELLYAGVAEGLKCLQDAGLTLVITTSKIRASAEALLKAAGIRHHFSLVAGADLVTRAKPDPEMAFLVMNELGLDRDNSVVVGDTIHDLYMAEGAGLSSIAVTYGVHDIATLKAAHPTHMADCFADVVRICLNTRERVTA